MADERPIDGQPSRTLAVGAPGTLPVPAVPWPILWRRRVSRAIETSDRYRTWVLAVSLSGMFAVGFTITILAVAIPTIADEFDAADGTVTWVVTGPILANALVGPALGRAGDLYGHRRVYLTGLALSALFAAGIALSWNPGSLIAFRVLAAAAGAATGPAAMAVINRVYPPHRRVQAMGYWSLVGAGGPVLGVIAGGPIVDHVSWRWIFVVQIPVTLVAAVLSALVLPETDHDGGVRFDVWGAVTLGASLAGLLFAINRGPEWGWGSAGVIAGFAALPVGLAAFVAVERRVAVPVVPLEYLRRRNFVMPCVAQMFANFAYMGSFILTPLLLINVYERTATEAGLLTIARPLAFAVTGPLIGWVATRTGERPVATAGATLLAVSMWVMSRAAVDFSDGLIVVGLALSGVALGSASPSLAASVANAVDERDFGVAGAVQMMASQIGVVVGITILQAWQLGREPTLGAAESFGEAYLVGGAATLVAIAAAATVQSTPRRPAG